MILDPPVTILFNQPLSNEMFKGLIDAMFGEKNNVFGFWGHPITLGEKKVHVYGADRASWRLIMVELTESRLTFVMPKFDKETVKRLIYNMKKCVGDSIKIYLGDKPIQEEEYGTSKKTGHD